MAGRSHPSNRRWWSISFPSMGWTQAELAERIGMVDSVSGATRVSRYETGQHDPDPATAEALAKALDLPVAYFHATSDLLAEVILVVSQLPAAKQREALNLVKDLLPTQHR